MAESSSLSWLVAVPWGLVAIGWIVANHQNNGRENRKDARAKIDSIRKSIDEVEDYAVQHHTSAQDLVLCMKIKRVMARISKEIQVVTVVGMKTDEAQRALTRLRQAATLNNFESSAYVQLAPSDPIVADIGATSDGLRSQLGRIYSERFQKRCFQRLLPR